MLRKRYIETGKVKYIYRPLIWDVEEKNGRLAAESLYCAGDEDKFWEMHDWMFLNVERWGQDPDIIGALTRLAVPEVGLDEATFRDCLETEKYRDHVVNLTNDATSRGITSTPTFLFNDTLVVGYLDIYEFRKAIEGDASVAPGIQLLLALGLPAALSLFMIGQPGSRVSRQTILLRMVIGVLALLGLLVAVYLSLYELQVSGNLACPLGGGECGKVNRSEYVGILGVPIGLIGVFGYGLILAIVLARISWRRLWGGLTGVFLIGLAAAGFLFSLYLTYLEIFQIQALCTWCVFSALLMTGILGTSIAAFVTEQRET